ncbi:HSP70-domain-containing protein [Rickenella mellea]|uniref:HSP70-domain-containing protein n=1 Tax=Rickenella mellea TaxID=50990 RepID=A0A4Y7PFA8_9AGAM|nr:HSP70-domain-containing protein [Rickenella mellea]
MEPSVHFWRVQLAPHRISTKPRRRRQHQRQRQHRNHSFSHGGNYNGNIEYRGENKGFTREEISSLVLIKMQETVELYVGTTIDGAVVTFPVYFNDTQHQATKDAGDIAGLRAIHFINQPADAIAYGLNKKSPASAMSLSSNLGGGSNIFIPISFNIHTLRRLHASCKCAKCTTPTAVQNSIQNNTHSPRRDPSVHEIVLVGGSMHIPKIVRPVSDFSFYGKEPNTGINLGEAIAFETAGGVIARRRHQTQTKKSEVFSACGNNQPGVHIQIPPAPRGVLQIANGTRSVSAANKTTGKSNRITTTNDKAEKYMHEGEKPPYVSQRWPRVLHVRPAHCATRSMTRGSRHLRVGQQDEARGHHERDALQERSKEVYKERQKELEGEPDYAEVVREYGRCAGCPGGLWFSSLINK